MWYIYALYSRPIDKFYTGVTNNFKRRLGEHKRGETQTTAAIPDIKFAYGEICVSKKDAYARERQLKTGFGRGYLRKRLQNYLKPI